MSVAMLLGTWKGIGWNMVVFLAALQTVPRDLYESAALDGAGTIAKFIYVTIPSIKRNDPVCTGNAHHWWI